MSLPDRRSIQTVQQSLPFNKPLFRLQAYLVELKTCVALLREVLVEVKELTVAAALIVFFIWSFIELLHRLHG